MFWADSLGANYIYKRLEAWSKMYGNFFKPCSYLAERAAKGISLVRFRSIFFLTFDARFNSFILLD